MVLTKEAEKTTRAVDAALELFHQGDLQQVRVVHLENLTLDLSHEDRLRTLLGLVAVEWMAGDIPQAHTYMMQAKELGIQFNPSTATLAMLHNNYALLLRKLAEMSPDNSVHYLDQAILEYTAASVYYEELGNVRYHAVVENNLAYLHLSMNRCEQALTHIIKAKELVNEIGDLTQFAYIYDTTAQIYLKMNSLEDAYKSINLAIEVLPESDMLPWFDVWSTYARILFRLGKLHESKTVLLDAIAKAEPLGQIKALCELYLLLLECCEPILLPIEIQSLYLKIYPLLTTDEQKVRLANVGYKLFSILSPPGDKKNSIDNFNHLLEKESIRRALINSGGVITHAAKSIDYSYQRLDTLLTHTYLDLAKLRTPRRPRRKSIIRKPVKK